MIYTCWVKTPHRKIRSRGLVGHAGKRSFAGSSHSRMYSTRAQPQRPQRQSIDAVKEQETYLEISRDTRSLHRIASAKSSEKRQHSSISDAGCWCQLLQSLALESQGTPSESTKTSHRLAPSVTLDFTLEGVWWQDWAQHNPGDCTARMLGSILRGHIPCKSWQVGRA